MKAAVSTKSASLPLPRLERSKRHADRMEDTRGSTEAGFAQSHPALRDVWSDQVQRTWDRLDGEQRATLNAEALGRASNAAMAEEVRASRTSGLQGSLGFPPASWPRDQVREFVSDDCQ